MIFDISSRRDQVRQAEDVLQAADVVELLHAPQFFRQGDDVDFLVVMVQVLHGFENRPVHFPVKIAGPQLFHSGYDGVVLQHHRAEHGLLRFYVLRRNPLLHSICTLLLYKHNI